MFEREKGSGVLCSCAPGSLRAEKEMTPVLQKARRARFLAPLATACAIGALMLGPAAFARESLAPPPAFEITTSPAANYLSALSAGAQRDTAAAAAYFREALRYDPRNSELMERAFVAALANGNMGADDFVRPGHIFPLIAKDGGVLMRSGHTEAAVDLCKLANLPPVGVICELANDDGSVMRGDQIKAFGETHNIKRISVADLIAYRQAREKLVERVASFAVTTEIGEVTGYAFVTPFDPVHHFAFVHGKIGDGQNIPTRLHRANVLTDVFGGGDTISRALQHFKKEGRGVLVYLRDGTSGVPVQALKGQVNSDDVRQQQWREIGLGAQILKDLGVSSIINLASSNRSYVGLSGFGIEIAKSEGV